MSTINPKIAGDFVNLFSVFMIFFLWLMPCSPASPPRLLSTPGQPPAITDGGSWVDGDFFWAAIPSPVVGTLHNELTLVGATGTISIRFEGLLTPTSDPAIFVLEGHWRVLRGTGGYLGLHGGGSVSTVFDFAESSASGTFTGSHHGD